MSITVDRSWLTDEDTISSSSFTAAPGYTAGKNWAKIVENIYGYKTYPSRVKENNSLIAFSALTHIKHPIFGSYLTSAPYSSYGGVWAKDERGSRALSHAAEELTRELKAEHAILRFRGDAGQIPDAWKASGLYRTYRLNLSAESATLENFSSNHRSHIRRSLKKGFTIKFGGVDILDETYLGLSRSMRELGSPYHAKKYLVEMTQQLGADVEFAVVYLNESIVGAGVFIFQGDEVINLHANILREYRSLYAGEFFYWSLIERYKAKGSKIFDLGRSLIGSGNEIFKTKWEPSVTPLNYWYYLPKQDEIPELNQKSPKFQIAIAIWKRLPQPIVNKLGPFLINGIA